MTFDFGVGSMQIVEFVFKYGRCCLSRFISPVFMREIYEKLSKIEVVTNYSLLQSAVVIGSPVSCELFSAGFRECEKKESFNLPWLFDAWNEKCLLCDDVKINMCSLIEIEISVAVCSVDFSANETSKLLVIPIDPTRNIEFHWNIRELAPMDDGY